MSKQQDNISQENNQPLNNIDSLGRSYGTGKRKNAVARVWIKKGSGKVTVNKRDAKEYFGREILFNIAVAPFAIVEQKDKFDVIATISGGGLGGQAGALSHGISKALALFDNENRPELRVKGYLTRDARVVERKKYGFKKARKGKTYRKR
ncbi:MAG: 30S ribosomal protein S9 [Rickettsiales bacterium]|jgi:small subunit ribosomal protein S9|nr:30S ribosomal protein S9 [Rickettsiales bacterium]|tara:strand:+ start:2227 stop:2676 length:450 start_codon:yes stop_codon:yes gene_type:complete